MSLLSIKTANLTGSLSRDAGGLYESVRRLVQSLQNEGMEVRVFGTADKHTVEDIDAWSPVTVTPFSAWRPKQFGYSPEFLSALEEFAPDLTHTHGLWLYSSVATNIYSRRHRVPYLISPHGMLDPWAIRNSYFKKALAHFFFEEAHLKEANCLRALCESEARSMRAQGLKNPIAVIPNGIDLPFRAVGDSPWSGRVEPGRKVLLFLSRIHPKKGLINLLKAWASLSKNGVEGHGKEWVLAIAGWDQGGHEAELKELCSELGIGFLDIREKAAAGRFEPSVVFLGPQFKENKAACYAHCDGFILPSLSEGVPMVVLEAWAYGKPVLMTLECNLPIGFDRDAAIPIATSPDSIANGLAQFFQASNAERDQLGRNGFALVKEQFAWPVIGRELTALYQWLLGGGDKPSSVTNY